MMYMVETGHKTTTGVEVNNPGVNPAVIGMIHPITVIIITMTITEIMTTKTSPMKGAGVTQGEMSHMTIRLTPKTEIEIKHKGKTPTIGVDVTALGTPQMIEAGEMRV